MASTHCTVSFRWLANVVYPKEVVQANGDLVIWIE